MTTSRATTTTQEPLEGEPPCARRSRTLPLPCSPSPAACGDDSDSSKSGGNDDEALAPKCSEVWLAGETLPEDYEGCMNGDKFESATSFNCKDGSSLFPYADDFWAFGGHEIHEEAGGVASTEP